MRLLTSLLTGLTLLCVGAGGSAGAGAARAPNSVAFWNPRVGLIGLDICRARCLHGAIALSDDGGKTSHVVFSTDQDALVVAARGERTAWIVTRRCGTKGCQNEQLSITQDRGRHWRLVADHPPQALDFATARLGMGVAGGNPYANGPTGIVVTRDGGRSWHHVHSPCRGWTGGASVTFPRPARAWALCTGEGGVGSEEKAVYESRDQGRTWRARAETIVFGHRRFHGGISFYGYPLGISLASDGSGLLWEGRGTLYSTQDGGRHWHQHLRVSTPEADFGIAGWSLLGGDAFVLLQRMPTIKLVAHIDRRWSVRRRWTLGP